MLKRIRIGLSFFKLRIPPPIVALFCAFVMRVVAAYSLSWEIPTTLGWIVVSLLCLLGCISLFWALLQFRKAKTTVNPTTPEKVSTLVVTGPFRFSRNPMYLGMALWLIAWAFHLNSPFSLLALIFFVSWLTWFQIIPEEIILLEKWGSTYTTYVKSVRRWL